MFSGMPILQKLRTMVSKAGVAPATPAEFGFLLGTRMHPADEVFDVELVEEQVAFTPAIDGHLLLAGGTGTGKTVLLRDLADEASQVMEVHVVDSWGTMDKAFALQPHGATTIGFTPAECTTMLEIVLAEVRRRIQRCELEDVTAFDDLQDPPRRILVILDDTHPLLIEEKFSCDRHPYREDKQRAVECIEEIAVSADRAGVTFVFASSWGEDETGLPAGVLEGPLSRLALRTDVYDFGSGSAREVVRYRHGRWQPSGQPEALLVVKDRERANPGT